MDVYHSAVETGTVTAVYVCGSWYDVQPGSFRTVLLTYRNPGGEKFGSGPDRNAGFAFVDAHSGTHIAGPLSTVQAVHHIPANDAGTDDSRSLPDL
jgi:hypothetical protein